MTVIYRSLLFAIVLLFAASALADGIVVVSTVAPETAKTSKELDARVERYGITRSDYKRIRETVPTIKRAVPVRTVPLKISSDTCAVDIRVTGTTPDLASLSPKMVGVQVEQGRFLTDHDLKTAAAVAIIDTVTAAKLFPDQNPIAGKSCLTPFKRDGLTYYTAKASEFTGEIQQVTMTLK